MGADNNKEVIWIVTDDETKPIRISFDDKPTYAIENETGYFTNISSPATFSAVLKTRPSKIVKIFWGTKLKWYQALWIDLVYYWEKGVKRVFRPRT